MSGQDVATVIASGGWGSRMGCDRPKALMRVCGRTLLEHALTAAAQSGSPGLLVYNNRREWDSAVAEITERFAGAVFVPDAGVKSTLELAIDAAHRIAQPRLCFLYGHAPRPERHLRRLYAGPRASVVSTLVSASTRTHPIPCGTAYLEPPYVLPVQVLRNTARGNWWDFWASLPDRVATVPVAGPGEANWPGEMRNYRRYVRHSYKVRAELQ